MSHSYQFCQLEVRHHLWIVTINRPEAMNALHPPANFELESIFNDFARDPNAWIAILTGAGSRAFSTGNDLKFQAAGGALTIPPTGFAGLTARFDLDKPVIAAVNGFALGGGFEIALACDLIVADENAVFALPEPKVGLAALAGGIHRLSRQIGEKQAMDMLLTARMVTAEEGLRMGFVNRIAAAGAALEKALEVAETMLQCSPVSLRATKNIQRQGANFPDLKSAITHPYKAIQMLVRSKDFVEGPKAFSEKRMPAWAGE